MSKLFIKLSKSATVSKREIYLKDIAELSGIEYVNSCKSLKITTLRCEKREKEVLSLTSILDCLFKFYPELEIESIGASDIVIEYLPKEDPRPLWEKIKVIFVCMIVFFGTAFSIIAFHCDIGIHKIFERIYMTFSDKVYPEVSILDISYSFGLCFGILLFFNHMGKWKFSKEPTPVQVELTVYEDEVNDTYLDKSNNFKNNS